MITPQELASMERELVGIQSLASANGGELMALGNSGRQVSVYSHDRLLWERDLRSHDDRIRPTERIRGLKFSNNGSTLYIACGPTVTAYNVETGALNWTYLAPRYLCFLVAVPVAIAVTKSDHIVVSQDAGRLVTLDPKGRELKRVNDNDAPRFLSLAIRGGQTEILGADGTHLLRWDLETGKKAKIATFEERIYSFSASKDGAILGVRLLHKALLLGNDGSQVAQLEVQPGLPVISVSPSGAYVALVEGDIAGIYRTNGERIAEGTLNGGPILALEWLTEDTLLMGDRDGNFGRFNLG